jgi:amino acid adenylation domain-containing protein
VNAPKGAIDDALKAALTARRDELLAHIASHQGRTTLRRVPRTPPLPLSFAQQRFWFLDRMDPGSARYTVLCVLRIAGPLDVPTMVRALDQTAHRHEMLRGRVTEVDGTPRLEIVDVNPSIVEHDDISQANAEAPEAEARRVIVERIVRPFDLGRDAPIRTLLVRRSATEHYLGIAIHHMAADGWSMALLAREIWDLYTALAAGRPSQLPPLEVQYVDWAAWQQERIATGEFARQLDYWQSELAGIPSVIELPTDRPRPPVLTHRGITLRRRLPGAMIDQLKELGRSQGATFYMVLLAAWQVLLHRYSGQDDIVVGSPIANRGRPELEGIVGCFVNNIALRGRLGGNPTFLDLLQQVKRTAIGAFANSEQPFEALVEHLQPDRDTSYTPIFQVLLTVHGFPLTQARTDGFEVSVVDTGGVGARFDIALDMMEVEGELWLHYEYATDLFDEATIARMHGHYERLMREIIADPTRRVLDLPLLTPDDEALVLETWNDTTTTDDRSRCIHDLVDERAQRDPAAVAVVASDATLNYEALNTRANRLAHLLRQRGVSEGALVGLCLDRTSDLPVALLGILKAGAAYVPVDPAHPAERLRYTLEDAAVACVITTVSLAGLLSDVQAPLLALDTSAAELAAMPTTSPVVRVAATDLAYVLYTSGSTGRPKGVEVAHHNVINFLESMRREPGMTSDDVLLAVTTLSFDIAGLELWLPLTGGGRVVLASRTDVLNGERLAAMLEQHNVTVMQATPATWRLMLDAGWTGKQNLKVLCGGEALPRDLAAELMPRVAELWNMYGPTETTIWSTVRRIDDPEAPITIGRPIDNTLIYILEPSGQPAPIGVAGELCIGGDGVARGYHNRPELTAEKFVPITLPGGRVERVYRTGDLARYRADGQIDFLGRRDQQVKVRGYRIELGEIEAVLATASGVKQCVVAVREDNPGDRRIVAYVVTTEHGAFDAEAAKAHLRERLPEYMVPSVFSIQPVLPLTPNGKIDRKALPAPHVVENKAAARVSDAMMTPAQRRVAAIWRDLLHTDHVGLHDNFFDVGGHSLLLVRLHASLKREFETPIELIDLFQATTVATQATRLTTGTAQSQRNAPRRAPARAAQGND